MTYVISVVQEKGGAGKTTLLCALASIMSSSGLRIAVIDTDPQRHLDAWASKDNLPLSWLYEENDEKLSPTVKALKTGPDPYDFVFIDTAGFKSVMAMHAIAAANLVLIPSKANEADAKGAIRTHSHVCSVSEAMEKEIAAYVVMMDVDAKTTITRSVIDALDAKGIPRLKTLCGHLTGFKEMTSTGAAPSGRALQVSEDLLREMRDLAIIPSTESAHA